MRTAFAAIVWTALVVLPGCGWFGPAIPDAHVVDMPHIGVQVQAPAGWEVKAEEKLGRTLLFVDGRTNRDHAVIVQKLSAHKTWREHADDFRDGQEHALDKITAEKEHEIIEGGTVFETRQERAGKPVVKKLRYFVEVGSDTYLLDMAAPESKFDAALYRHVAESLKPNATP